MASGFATIETRFDEIFANFPNRPVAWLLRFLMLPFGARQRGPSDRLTQACAEILLEPSATRDRLTVDIFPGTGDDGRRAARARVRADGRGAAAARPPAQGARPRHREGARQGLINDAEAAQLHAAAEAVAAAVAVDDFAPEELSPRLAKGDVLSQTMSRPTAAE